MRRVASVLRVEGGGLGSSRSFTNPLDRRLISHLLVADTTNGTARCC